MENDYIETNPTLGIRKPAKEESRDRVLNKDEIRAFWQATEKVGFPFGPMAQILLLTGQRLGEVTKMTDDEVDGDLWSMAKDRTKNGRAHIVPLSDMVRNILDGIPRVRVVGCPLWILSTTGRTPVQGFDGAKSSINAAMATVLPHWTFHDLRRTCASGMAELGVATVVIEAVLNHASGVRASVAGVYNRHDYAKEKRAALDLWADHVLGLIRVR
jgi:integrase